MPSPSERPTHRVKVKARCLLHTHRDILLLKARDYGQTTTYYTLPGGSIEFQETACAAIIREISEELGVDLVQPVFMGVIENMFSIETRNGTRPGHDITFLFSEKIPWIDFSDQLCMETNGVRLHPVWIPFESAITPAITVYPAATLPYLKELAERVLTPDLK